MSYYENKIETLVRLFGSADIEVSERSLRVGEFSYPIIDDVIVVLPELMRPGARSAESGPDASSTAIATDVQRTFGQEWRRFNTILPEQESEFAQYFDIVDLGGLGDAVVCDLGAGMGRWSSFIIPHCSTVVLVDFSDAIHVARENLRDHDSAVFVMADIAHLPFADDCCDFAMCLGVLHTLPSDPIATVRALGRLGPRLLVYLMYDLDNRAAHFRVILRLVTAARVRLARIHDERTRQRITSMIAATIYRPMMAVGRLSRCLGIDRHVPLAVDHEGKSTEGIKQVVYDRFFTPVEQRVSAEQIMQLKDSFSYVNIAESRPYWHFLCER